MLKKISKNPKIPQNFIKKNPKESICFNKVPESSKKYSKKFQKARKCSKKFKKFLESFRKFYNTRLLKVLETSKRF
jgi:hypothetical protein